MRGEVHACVRVRVRAARSIVPRVSGRCARGRAPGDLSRALEERTRRRARSESSARVVEELVRVVRVVLLLLLDCCEMSVGSMSSRRAMQPSCG